MFTMNPLAVKRRVKRGNVLNSLKNKGLQLEATKHLIQIVTALVQFRGGFICTLHVGKLSELMLVIKNVCYNQKTRQKSACSAFLYCISLLTLVF